MPELPEVETIKLDLQRLIKNKKIKSVDINLAKQVKTPRTKFLRLVQGIKVKQVKRRAKMLLIELVNGYFLVFHLKMTGQLIYKDKNKLAGGGHPIKYKNLENDFKRSKTGSFAVAQDKLFLKLPNKYSHVVFNFSDGSQLFFNDTRQFGWVKLLSKKELKELEQNLGPEPLKINSQQFIEIFKNKKIPIKPVLMEQKLLVGVGNIYAMEACWCAGIKPTKLASELTQQEFKKLFNCLTRILKLAIKKKGTTAKDYVDALGRKGSMWLYLKVYGRNGQKCKRCDKELILIKQRQRATVYCGKCQK